MDGSKKFYALRSRRSRRGWFIIIGIAIGIHLIIFLLLKPAYLNVFKTELPGDGGTAAFKTTDRPFSLISIPEPPSEKRKENLQPAPGDNETEHSLLDDLGEPALDIKPMSSTSNGGGRVGRPGPRNITVEPKPMYIPWPKYPDGARRNIEGKVELMLFVNERGEVQEIRVSKGLPEEILNRSAVEAAREIRFVPGQIEGVPTSMWVRLTIGFQPR